MSSPAIAIKTTPRTVEVDVMVPTAWDGWDEPHRYKVAYGGRAGTKSWTIAQKLILRAMQGTERILCCREIQNSIADSVHSLLADQIIALGLTELFIVHDKKITCLRTGSTFIFKGLKHNIETIKSLEGVTICWVEEAQRVSEVSWKKLIPTIRTAGSEIWISFNPDLETDPTYKRFITNTPPHCLLLNVNSTDNPWLTDEMRNERSYDYQTDANAAAHIWGGSTRVSTDAQILHGKITVQSFKPKKGWHGPYYGGDWGFAKDPTTLVKLWIEDVVVVLDDGAQVKRQKLYVEKESYAIRLETTDTADRWKRDIPEVAGKKNQHDITLRPIIYADNARPETISQVRRDGLNVVAAKKWPGSVEDGIAFLRGFADIVVHPDCRHFEQESRLYSYKTDKLTEGVLAEIIKKHDHCIDASRYGLGKVIKQDEYAVGGFL